jgi:hypothetical protein
MKLALLYNLNITKLVNLFSECLVDILQLCSLLLEAASTRKAEK